MKISIPNSLKGLKGTVFSKLFSIEMNDFSVEMLLPALFFLIESKGKMRKNRTDSTTISEYIKKANNKNKIIGFDTIEGERVFEKWVKTSLLEIGKKGRKKTIDQILYFQPLTYMTLKPGFPSASSRLRNVPNFIYSLLLEPLINRCDKKEAYYIIRSYFREAFAQGVVGLPEKEPGLGINGHYDNSKALDIESLMSLYFMDVFENPAEISTKLVDAQKPVCKGQVKRFMEGMIKFIEIYKNRMSARELIYNLQILINFELLIYTLKLVHGTNSLVKYKKTPLQFSLEDVNHPPFIYVDFSDSPTCLSREIARLCTNRDLQEVSKYFKSNIHLRTLDYIVQTTPTLKSLYDDSDNLKYLEKLVNLNTNIHVNSKAEIFIEEIKIENKNNISDDYSENTVVEEFLDQLDKSIENGSDRLTEILDKAQRNTGAMRCFMWIRDVSGITKNFGILKGSLKRRNTWAYAISNDLLWVLVHLAAINPSQYSKNEKLPDRFRLVDFLSFLKTRYGILVNEVPEEFNSFDANRVARENLTFLQKRLKKMGLFENLSDDYEAQYINPHYKYIK